MTLRNSWQKETHKTIILFWTGQQQTRDSSGMPGVKHQASGEWRESQATTGSAVPHCLSWLFWGGKGGKNIFLLVLLKNKSRFQNFKTPTPWHAGKAALKHEMWEGSLLLHFKCQQILFSGCLRLLAPALKREPAEMLGHCNPPPLWAICSVPKVGNIIQI